MVSQKVSVISIVKELKAQAHVLFFHSTIKEFFGMKPTALLHNSVSPSFPSGSRDSSIDVNIQQLQHGGVIDIYTHLTIVQWMKYV